MPGWAPYLLVMIFFAGLLPLVLFGARERDVVGEDAARAKRTAVRVHALGQLTKVLAAGVAAIGAIVGAILVFVRLRRHKTP
jgi:ABC-type Fe3+-siderophore transport system permease subunit